MSDEVLDTNNEAATFRERLMAYALDNVLFVFIPAALIRLYLPDLWDELAVYFAGFGSFHLALMYHGYESIVSFVSLVMFEQTPGKKILNCRVLAKDGSRANTLQLFLREFFGKYISGTIMWVGYLLAAARKDHKALHDLMSDTKVVRDVKNNGSKYLLNKNLAKVLILQLLLASIGLKIKYDFYQKFNKKKDESPPFFLKWLSSKEARKDSLLKDKRDLYAEEVKKLNALRLKEEEEKKEQQAAAVVPPDVNNPVANQPVTISKIDPLSDDNWIQFYKYGDKVSEEDSKDSRFTALKAKHRIRYQAQYNTYLIDTIRDMNSKGAAIHLEFFDDPGFMTVFKTKCLEPTHMMRFKSTYYGAMTSKGRENYIRTFQQEKSFSINCLIEPFKEDIPFLRRIVQEVSIAVPVVAQFTDNPDVNEFYFKQKAESALKRIKRNENQIRSLHDSEFASGEIAEYILLNHPYQYSDIPRQVVISEDLIIKMLKEVPQSARFLRNYTPSTPANKKLYEANLNASLSEVAKYCRKRLENISAEDAEKWTTAQALAKTLPGSFLNQYKLVSNCTQGLEAENTFFHALFQTGSPSEEFKEMVIKENQRRASLGIGYLTFPTNDPNFNSRLHPRK